MHGGAPSGGHAAVLKLETLHCLHIGVSKLLKICSVDNVRSENLCLKIKWSANGGKMFLCLKGSMLFVCSSLLDFYLEAVIVSAVGFEFRTVKFNSS